MVYWGVLGKVINELSAHGELILKAHHIHLLVYCLQVMLRHNNLIQGEWINEHR